jgi:hypothetical protein
VLGQVLADLAVVQERARAVAEGIAGSTDLAAGAYSLDAVGDETAVGGGSWSATTVPSAAVRIRCKDERAAVALAKRLRLNDPPVFPRVKGNEVRINMRTVMPYEDVELASVLSRVLVSEPRGGGKGQNR